MYKLIALYKKPKDEKAFMEHYEKVHTPIVKSIPGLKDLVINRVTGNPMGGDPDYYMIVEMLFETKEDFNKGMSSAENMAAGKDIGNFARGLVSVMTATS